MAIDDQHRRLLGLLACGHSVTKAARRLHLSLTARERELLGLVADGLRDGRIATRLGTVPSTVGTLLRSALKWCPPPESPPPR